MLVLETVVGEYVLTPRDVFGVVVDVSLLVDVTIRVVAEFVLVLEVVGKSVFIVVAGDVVDVAVLVSTVVVGEAVLILEIVVGE